MLGFTKILCLYIKPATCTWTLREDQSPYFPSSKSVTSTLDNKQNRTSTEEEAQKNNRKAFGGPCYGGYSSLISDVFLV